MRGTNALLCGFAAFMALAVCNAAHAEDWKVTGSFGWFGVGKAYQIEKGHVYFVGEFSGTFFNDKGKGSLFDQAGVKPDVAVSSGDALLAARVRASRRLIANNTGGSWRDQFAKELERAESSTGR